MQFRYLCSPTPKCTSGCPRIDAMLRGGVPCGSITEIAGMLLGLTRVLVNILHNYTAPQESPLQAKASCACSCSCTYSFLSTLAVCRDLHCMSCVGVSLHYACTTTVNALYNRYIYTEGSPALGRLRQMARSFETRWGPRRCTPSSTTSQQQHLVPSHRYQQQQPCMSEHDIFIERTVSNAQDLLDAIHRIPRYLHQPGHKPLRLVVIDSIANVFRDPGEETTGSYTTNGVPSGRQYIDRSNIMFQVHIL